MVVKEMCHNILYAHLPRQMEERKSNIRGTFLTTKTIQHPWETAIARSFDVPQKPCSPYLFDIQRSTLARR